MSKKLSILLGVIGSLILLLAATYPPAPIGGATGAVAVNNGVATNLVQYISGVGKSHLGPYWTNVNFFTPDDMAYMDESNHVLFILREDSAHTNRVLYIAQEVGLNANNTHDAGQSGMSAVSTRVRAIHDVDGTILPYSNPNPRIVWTMAGDIQNTAEFAFENETNLFFKFYDIDSFTIQFYKIVSCNNFTNPTVMTFGTNRVQMELEAGTQITAKTNLSVLGGLWYGTCPINTNFTAYAAGTAYTLTVTPALLDFGTTDPSITIQNSGTYRIVGRAGIKYTGSTYGSAQTLTLKLRRTNNTAADLASSSRAETMPVLTTYTGGDLMATEEVIYTATAGDIIQIFGSVSALPSAGSVVADSADIIAIRIY